MDVPASSRAFIGRGDELAQLAAAFEDTRKGRSSAVVISGESGVGKTRLVHEVVSWARDEGATVLIGGCSDFGDEGPSFWPFIEALRAVENEAVSSPEGEAIRTQLTALLPGLPRPSVATGFGDLAGSGQISLFEPLLRVLSGMAEQAPVILVIEDVHWADRSTRDLLVFLLANLHRDAVMVIATYRSDAVTRGHSLQPLLAELRRNRRADFIDLPPFTRDELVDQLTGILGRVPEEELVELTWSRSDGNAFFVEELVAAVVAGYGRELPPTLRHILMCRVDMLSEPARRVLRLVAVAGEGVTHGLMAAVAGVSETELAASLRECVEHHLLSVLPHGQTYKFRHSLMQEVLYGELLPGEKRLFHAAFGRALSKPSDRPDSAAAAKLAYHWYAAGDDEKALVAALEAAVAAAGIYGFAEAQRHYERAIELWDVVPGARVLVGLDRLTLYERAAEVANMAGEHRRASALINAAVAELPAGDTSIRGAVLRQRLGRYLWASGDSLEALKAYEEAVRCVPPGLRTAERARVEGAYAEALMLSGRYRMSRAQAETALDIARQAGAQLEETQILATLGFDLAYLGEPSSGVSALERGLDIAEAVGSPDDIGRAYLNLAELLSGPLNRLAEAAEIAERGMAQVGLLGLERTYGVALQAIAINTLFRLGRWTEADRFLQEALACKPTGTAAIDLCLARAKLSVGRGDYEAAEADLKAVETLSSGGLGPRYEAPLLTLRAGLDLWLGRPERARDGVNRGIMASVSSSDDVWLLAPLIWHGLRAEADLAERARARRAPHELEVATTMAAGLLVQVRSLAEQSRGAAASIRQAVSAYLRLCEAEASRAGGDPKPEIWNDAAGMWRQLHQPYPAAYALWREAEALLAQRTRSTRAAEALREAHRVAVALGAEPFRRLVEELAARARIVLPPPPTTAPLDARLGQANDDPEAGGSPRSRFGITGRELEVLRLMALGRSNREIADTLFISVKTVSVHLSHIFRKLGVNTRVHASALAQQLGLVDVVGGTRIVDWPHGRQGDGGGNGLKDRGERPDRNKSSGPSE